MSESCSIITEKYGELFFSKITGNLSDIVEKADNENIIPILMKESYSEELNKNIKKEDIDFYSFSEDEQKDFWDKFVEMPFFNRCLSDCKNLRKAVEKASKLKAVRMKAILPTFPVFTSCGIQMPDRFLQLTKMVEKMEKLAAMDTIKIFLPSTLSNFLKNYENFQGSYIARINEQGKTLSNQIGMLAKFGLISPEIKSTAISFFPDYTVSTIYRDEDNNVDVYAKNPKESDGAECNIKNVVQYKKFMDTLNISRNEAMTFLGYLQEYPYLALIDDVGKKIFEAVQTEIFKYIKKEKNNTLYHARGKEKGKPDFTPLQMREVQYGISGMGRYSFLGQSRYYLATDVETAKKEVECDKFPESTVMELQQIKEKNVFDISSEDCPLASLCNMPKEDGNDYTAYLIPNFIAVCCAYLNKKQRHSIDAIKYKSNKNEKGYCYVILDEPSDFVDFNNGKVLSEQQ